MSAVLSLSAVNPVIETVSVPGSVRGQFERDGGDCWIVHGVRVAGDSVSRPLVVHPIAVTWRNDVGKVYEIVVPQGFPTDLASVPRLFRPSVSRAGRYDLATIVHDWLYYQNGVGWRDAPEIRMPRAEADQALLDVMTAIGIGWWTRRKIHAAVRVGGWVAW